LRDIVDHVEVLEIPVYTWRWSCQITSSRGIEPCVLLPYSASLKDTIKPSSVLALKPGEVDKLDIEGKVVLVDYPDAAEKLRFLVYEISCRRPAAVLLVTPRNALLKSDVVLGTPGFTYALSAPLKVPVVCVDRKVASVIASEGADVEFSSNMSKGSGRLIIASLNGRGDLEVHLTSHHDSIIGGSEASPASMLYSVVDYLRKRDLPVNVTVISYTAREVGDFDFTEYHYTWGERYLLKLLESKGKLENVEYSMSISPLSPGNTLKVVAHPALGKYLEDIGVHVSHNHFFLESHPYMEAGIPALVVTSDNSYWHRNTTLSRAYEEGVVARVRELIALLLEKARPSEEWVKATREYILDKTGEACLELRVNLTRLMDLVPRTDALEWVKTTTRLAYSTLYVACTRPLGVYVNSSLVASISSNSMASLRSFLSQCEGGIVVGDQRAYVPVNQLRGLEDFYLDNYAKYLARALKPLIDYEAFKILYRFYVKRCLGDGEKSHWDK